MFTQFTLRQSREFSDTMQTFEGIREVEQRQRANRGTVAFRNTNGHDYLVKWLYEDGKRKAKVIGKRSPETEAVEREFNDARAAMDKRVRSLRTNLAAQARLNVATGLARMPLISANTIRAFNRAGIGHTRIKLVGTNALYAYEAMAAGYFETGLVSTQDIDLLLNQRAPLRIIASDDVPEETLISVLRSADRSFEITRQPFRASNRDGFLVDIIKPERNPPWVKEPFEPAQNDIQPSPITGLVWLESAQSFEQPVIDAKGMPVMLCVPDPRVFAIHKFWLSQLLDRGPLKARRDRAQAFALASLVMNEMKHLPFDGRSLRMIPRDIATEAIAAFKAESERK